MHPARFGFLTWKHAQHRYIAARERTNTGAWKLALECGHSGSCAAHFDCSKTEQWSCHLCGEEYVRSAPQYANEFKEV